jgi:hypothetical protein
VRTEDVVCVAGTVVDEVVEVRVVDASSVSVACSINEDVSKIVVVWVVDKEEDDSVVEVVVVVDKEDDDSVVEVVVVVDDDSVVEVVVVVGKEDDDSVVGVVDDTFSSLAVEEDVVVVVLVWVEDSVDVGSVVEVCISWSVLSLKT